MMNSLSSRIIITAGSIFIGFMVMMMFLLDNAVRKSMETSLQERLRAHANMIIAASEQGADGMTRLTQALPDLRFFAYNSGLYGQIRVNGKLITWSSPSSQSIHIPFIEELSMGESKFKTLNTSDGIPLMSYALGIRWGQTELDLPVTIEVAESLLPLQTEARKFRQLMVLWFTAAGIILLLIQAVILKWGLSPIRDVAARIKEIEAGKHTKLEQNNPRELQILTQTINDLLDSEHARKERYRNALGDLAHSLKTPLALLRSSIHSQDKSNLAETVEEQVARMTTTVERELQNAATAGYQSLAQNCNVFQVAQRITAAMVKVSGRSDVHVVNNIPAKLVIKWDEHDLMEVLGNIVDNAFKWCRSTVSLGAELTDDHLTIFIEDDGPGADGHQLDIIKQRGYRLDATKPGQGLGLDIVDRIVKTYQSELLISKSEHHGGLKVTISSPIDQHIPS